LYHEIVRGAAEASQIAIFVFDRMIELLPADFYRNNSFLTHLISPPDPEAKLSIQKMRLQALWG
jgi:hypothetical protein